MGETFRRDEDVFLIEFVYECLGDWFHGTVSLKGDTAAAIWTVDRGDGKKTEGLPLTEAQFQDIWDGLNDVPDIARGAVHEPQAELDFRENHLIAALFTLPDQRGRRAYLVNPETASEAYWDWLRKIGYPGLFPNDA